MIGFIESNQPHHTPESLGLSGKNADTRLAIKDIAESSIKIRYVPTAHQQKLGFFTRIKSLLFDRKELEIEKAAASQRASIVEDLIERVQDTKDELEKMKTPVESVINEWERTTTGPNEQIQLIHSLVEQYGAYSLNVVPTDNKDATYLVARGLRGGDNPTLLFTPNSTFTLTISGSYMIKSPKYKKISGRHANDPHNKGNYAEDSVQLFVNSVDPRDIASAIDEIKSNKNLSLFPGSIKLQNRNGSFGQHNPQFQTWTATIGTYNSTKDASLIRAVMQESQKVAVATADRTVLKQRAPRT